MVRQKKIMYQTTANGGTCQKGFLASSHTTSTAQSGEHHSRHTELNTVAAVFSHKQPSLLSESRLWMFVIHLGTTAWHFLGTMNQNVLKTMMLYKNIFPLARNGKLHLQGQPYFYSKLSQLQKTPKLGTLVYTHYQKQRKISARSFQSKFEVGRKKHIFTMVQFLLLAFLKDLTSFLSLSHARVCAHTHTHTHTHTHSRLLSVYVCCIMINKNT